MRISDWSSDVCSSDLPRHRRRGRAHILFEGVVRALRQPGDVEDDTRGAVREPRGRAACGDRRERGGKGLVIGHTGRDRRLMRSCHCFSQSAHLRSEEHTSELQSLMRISYAVFCLKKKKNNKQSYI